MVVNSSVMMLLVVMAVLMLVQMVPYDTQLLDCSNIGRMWALNKPAAEMKTD